jgi:hypothetical protein
MKLYCCLAFAFLLAGSAHGLKLGPDGLKVSATEVMVSRRFTVSAELVDDTRDGAVTMETILQADPAEAVVLTGSRPPVSFGCTGTGTIRGWWEFAAMAPGSVTFRLDSSMFTCTQNVGMDVKAVSVPVSILPVSLWSAVGVSPRFLAPGEETELRISLRNDSGEDAVFSTPFADMDMIGPGGPLAVPSGPVSVDPAGAFKNGHLTLAPGRQVSVMWKFRAKAGGQGTFRAIAAGLLIKSETFVIRPAPGLRLELPEIVQSTAVGREFTLRGLLRQSGGAGIAEPYVALSLSPAGMARILSASLSSTAVLAPDGEPVAAVFRLETLKPGSLILTLTAGGREADTGRAVSAAVVKRDLRVQPPPRILLRLDPASTSVIAGSKTAIRIMVANRASSAAQGMSPVITVGKGRASVLPLSPIFQGVPAGGTVYFAGAIVTAGEGDVELAVQATTRSDRGGEWTTVQSDPVTIKSVLPPRFSVTTLKDRAYTGVTETLRFRLTNESPWPVRLAPPTISLSGDTVGSLTNVRKPQVIMLAAGAGTTIIIQAYLPPAPAAYEVTAMLYISGTIVPFGLGFNSQTGNRPLVLACPNRTDLVRVSPAPVFRPPLDPMLFVEWTMTAPGTAGIAVMTAAPDSRLVRTLGPLKARPTGFGSALWTGDDDAGAPVPSGRYVVILAGPVSSTLAPGEGSRAWPATAAWRRDTPIEIIRR